MEKIELLIPVFYKILRNKKDISVSQIYGEMYNTRMFRDFILKLGVTSYDIVVASYALYHILTDSNLNLSDAILKGIHNIFLVTSITIEDTSPITVNCPHCGGDGKFECGECNGDGTTTCDECDGSGVDKEREDDCDNCDGQGETYCSSCDGEGYLDCSECGGSGEFESDEYEVGHSKDYWVVSNPEVVTQFKMRDENAYIDTDTFEDIIDVDKRTSLFLGYSRDTIEVKDFIAKYDLDVEDVNYRDTFLINIEEVAPSIILKRLVGLGKFGQMI